MLTLEMLKHQCHVDFDDDDEILQGLLESAIEETVRLTGRDMSELIEMSGRGCLPAPLEQAALVRASQLYDKPGGDEKGNVLYYSLIRPYQKI